MTRTVALALAALGLAACATPAGTPESVATLRPGERPAPGSQEAGLWMQMDRAEVLLHTSSAVMRDPALNDYVRGIVCRLAGRHCDGVRVYIIRQPEFNASMAPNGMMQVWTGLLLRTENEAQLAFVLGHELGHYLRRHSLQQMRDVNAKSAFVQVLSMALGLAAGAAGELAMLGSVYAFSRDGEREADEVGFDLTVRAGYDPREAPRIWERLMAEASAGGKARPPIFFATHPPADERVAALEQLAARSAKHGGAWGAPSIARAWPRSGDCS